MNLYHEGKPLMEIRRAIDEKYEHKYNTRTPTPLPPEQKKQ